MVEPARVTAATRRGDRLSHTGRSSGDSGPTIGSHIPLKSPFSSVVTLKRVEGRASWGRQTRTIEIGLLG
jgi:hypothetical protein